MLNVNNLEVVYNDIILVLRGISLTVPDNSIIAFLGANGAGKSTTLRAISGLLDYEDGEIKKGAIEFNNQRIDGWTLKKWSVWESPRFPKAVGCLPN